MARANSTGRLGITSEFAASTKIPSSTIPQASVSIWPLAHLGGFNLHLVVFSRPPDQVVEVLRREFLWKAKVCGWTSCSRGTPKTMLSGWNGYPPQGDGCIICTRWGSKKSLQHACLRISLAGMDVHSGSSILFDCTASFGPARAFLFCVTFLTA